jgi:uncharacterized protein YggU (UPF0235/DUF167 family)
MGKPEATAARLTVQVQPRAHRSEIVARGGTSLRVRVTAPPAGGAANTAVCELVARALDCPPSAVTILRGHSARTKLLGIAGVTPVELKARLATLPA